MTRASAKPDCASESDQHQRQLCSGEAQAVGLAAADPLVGWVDTDDLEHGESNIHLTKEGRTELGERFAKKAIELIPKK